jgi:hypothetical protein
VTLPDIRLGRPRPDAVLRAMLESLAAAPGAGPMPFAHFVGDPRDWAVSVCAAWARVAEVLTFYSERVLNDAFLATAQTEHARTLLYASLGHPQPPHAAATTHVSYTVRDTPAGVEAAARARRSRTGSTAAERVRAAVAPGDPLTPPGVVTVIPEGALVQALPKPGSPPVVYATTEPLDAYVGASSAAVAQGPPSSAPVLTTRTTQVELTGTRLGLVPGDAVLVTGRAPTSGALAMWPRALVAVAVDSARGTTRVAWAEPLDPAVDAPVADASVYMFAASTPLFGADAAEWTSVRDVVRLATPTALGPTVPPLGGVVRSADDGVTWTPVAPLDAIAVATVGGIALVGTATGLSVDSAPQQALPRRAVLWVGGTPERLFATQAGTVWQSLDRGRTWDALAGGPPALQDTKKPSRAQALVADALALASLDPELRTATAAAKKATPATPPRSRQVVQHRLPNVAVRGIAAEGSVLVAATDAGAYHYLGGDWLPDGLAEPVLALATSGGRIWAATTVGVRVRSAKGSWSAVGTLAGPVYALVPAAGRVVAATAHGVHIWRGSVWSPASQGLPPGAVLALAAPTGALVCAPATGGIYRSTDLGESWQRCDAQELWTGPGEVPPEGPVPPALAGMFDGQGLPVGPDATVRDGVLHDGAVTYRLVAAGEGVRVLREGAYGPVAALAVDGADLLAAAPYTGPAATEWPAYGVGGRTVDLVKTVPGTAPGTYALLDERSGTKPAFAVVTVTAVERPTVVSYGGRGTVSRLLVDPPVAAGTFSRRATRVWTGATPVPLSPSPTSAVAVVSGNSIPLAEPLSMPLPAGRTAVITGRPVRLALAPAGGVGGLIAADVRSVAVTGHGDVVAASAEGVHVLPDRAGTPLTFAVVGGARAVVARGDGALAATASGVIPVARGLGTAVLTGDVVALVAGDGRFAAATAAGAVAVSADGTTWQSLPPLPGVSALAVEATAVHAVTPAGVMRCAGSAWVTAGPGAPAATALAVGGGRVWAAAPDGLWSLSAGSSRWRRDPEPRLAGPVLAVAPGPVAVTTTEVLVSRGAQWEAAPLATRGVAASVATDRDGTPVIGYAAGVPVQPPQSGHGYSYLFASAPLAPVDLAALDLGGGLPPAVAAAFTGAGATLDPHALSVTGHGNCWVVRSGSAAYLLAPRTDGAVTWVAGYAIVCATVVGPASGGTWPVAGGTVSADAAEVVLLAAAPDGPAFAEVVTIDGADDDVRLARPLEHVYDAATVALHLNVAAAVQGRPVSVPIGSGNPETPHQSFAVQSPVASVGTRDTLRIFVGSAEWQPVANLDTAGAGDHVYTQSRGPHGSVTVTFGDGIHGARLPAGHGNVVASYVEGGGAAGEAAPGELLQPLTRPQLVTGVINPVAALRPATSSIERMAAAAPTLGRAVSVADALMLARAVPGVASVAADLVATGDGRAVVVTVAPAPNAPPALAAEVGAALAAAGMRVYAVVAEPAPVAVSLAVVGAERAYAAVRAAVLGVSAASPGEPLHATAVVAAATAVPGIASARLIAWNRGARAVTDAAYTGRRAGWQGTGLPRPAELVIVGGVDVRADGASAVVG